MSSKCKCHTMKLRVCACLRGCLSARSRRLSKHKGAMVRRCQVPFEGDGQAETQPPNAEHQRFAFCAAVEMLRCNGLRVTHGVSHPADDLKSAVWHTENVQNYFLADLCGAIAYRVTSMTTRPRIRPATISSARRARSDIGATVVIRSSRAGSRSRTSLSQADRRCAIDA